MVELRGMTWDHPRGFDPMVATSITYAETYPDVRITWDKRSLEDFESLPIEKMASTYDLMVIDHPHVGDVAANGLLVAFDTIGRAEELSHIEAGSVGPTYRSYVYEGHVWALPIDTAAPVAAFRPDRLEAPCADWDAVIALAEQGGVIMPLKPTHATMAFLGIAFSSGFPVAETQEGLISTAEGKAVLTMMNAVVRHGPTEAFSMNPIDVFECMSTDNRFVYCPHAYGYVSYSLNGFRPYRLRFADFSPVGTDGKRGTILGGTGIAVSSRSAHPNIACDYALWIASAACQKGLFFSAGGQPAHTDAWNDARINAQTLNFFKDTRRSLDMATIRPRHNGYLPFQETGGAIINAFLTGNATADHTVERLNAAYRETFVS